MSHSDWSDSPIRFMTPFYIALFFVCAGYTTNPEISISLKHKAKHILLPYLYCNIILIACSMPFIGFSLTGIAGIFYSRLGLYPENRGVADVDFFIYLNSVTWFYTALFSSYLYYKLLLMCKGAYRIMLALAYVVMAYAMAFLPILLPWSLDSAPLFAVFIYAGRLIRKYRIEEKRLAIVAAAATYAILLMCHLGSGWNLSVRQYGHSILIVLIAGVAGPLFMLGVFKLCGKWSIMPALSKISKYSMTIFGLQALGITLVATLMIPMGLPHEVIGIVELMAAVGLGIVGGKLYGILTQAIPAA